MGDFGQIPDPDRLMGMRADPGDRLANPGQMAVGARKFTKLSALRALQEPKQHLPLEHGRKHGNLRWPVKQPQHSAQRVEQVVINGRGGEPVAAEDRPVLNEECGDSLQVKGQANGQIRTCGARFDYLADAGRLDSVDEIAGRVVTKSPVADQNRLRALQYE